MQQNCPKSSADCMLFLPLSHLTRLLLSLFLFACLVPSTALALTKEQRKKIQQQAKRLHSKGNYPRALPSNTLDPPKKPPVSWLEKLLRKLLGKGLVSSFKFGNSLGGFLKIAIIVLLVLLVGLLLWALLRAFSVVGSTDIDAEVMDAEEGFMGFDFRDDMDANEVAGDGQFEVAICLLLWKALRQTGWRPEGRGASQTGRELVYRMSPMTRGHSSLMELLYVAERVRFSDLKADAELYAEAKREFDTFVQVYEPPEELQRIYSAKLDVNQRLEEG